MDLNLLGLLTSFAFLFLNFSYNNGGVTLNSEDGFKAQSPLRNHDSFSLLLVYLGCSLGLKAVWYWELLRMEGRRRVLLSCFRNYWSSLSGTDWL